jgi:hypothetical protein
MVIGGELQNVPSDGLERAVSSALVLSGGAPPAGVQATEQVAPPADAPVPMPRPEQRAVTDAQLADPGSTGGLLDP